MDISDNTKRRKIHQRSIDTAVYEGAADTIIVEGTLQDRRFLPSHLPTGDVRPPRTVHHMIIRMELHLPDLEILDIAVEMPATPHDACAAAAACLDAVRGTRIAPGFLARVRRLVDRKTGCTHLSTLLAAMAPAAFQGAWSARVSRPVDQDTYAAMVRKLVNTCRVWQKDGELVRRLLGPEES